MLYTEKEKNEIERVRKVFEKHIQQMTAYDLVWSDKVGYYNPCDYRVLAVSQNPQRNKRDVLRKSVHCLSCGCVLPSHYDGE